MEQMADQYQLCCGSLLDAEWKDGQVTLRCIRCGQGWERLDDGLLSRTKPASITTPPETGKLDP